jgi:hypothetical protein
MKREKRLGLDHEARASLAVGNNVFSCLEARVAFECQFEDQYRSKSIQIDTGL